MASRVDVAVVGTAMVDLIAEVSALPDAGGTTFGTPLRVAAGGKGLNQAIAAARAGARVALVADIGDDPWGQLIYTTLQQHSVDTQHVRARTGTATGATFVQIPPGGDAAVTVMWNPLLAHTATTISAASATLSSAGVVVIQLELGPDAIAATLQFSATKIGTLAPRDSFPDSLWRQFDVLVVNAAEAAAILHQPVPRTPREALAAATALTRCTADVVVTLGAQGAGHVGPHGSQWQDTVATAVVDTTGAGDAFLGTLCAALASGAPLGDALPAAVRAGTVQTQRTGPN